MSYHRETEYALDRIESALSDAQQALSCMSDVGDIESELGALADNLRSIHSAAEELLTTDLEDAEGAIREVISLLDDVCTDASTLYNSI